MVEFYRFLVFLVNYRSNLRAKRGFGENSVITNPAILNQFLFPLSVQCTLSGSDCIPGDSLKPPKVHLDQSQSTLV